MLIGHVALSEAVVVVTALDQRIGVVREQQIGLLQCHKKGEAFLYSCG